MAIHLRSPRSARSVSLAVVISLLATDAGAGPGDLDVTFGTGGKVITDFGPGNDGADAVAIQADGKTVAAGYSRGDVGSDFALVRYNVDGSLDASFGVGGKVATDSGFDQALALVIQADGKIVAAGDARLNFGLARYNTDGSLDTTFDGDGIVTTAFAGFAMAWAVAIQPDGRIVAAGGLDQPFLARYNSDGSLDPTFGVGGRVTGAPPGGWFTAVAIQADGRIVAAGRGDMSDDFLVWRYNTDGSPDVAFGTGGSVLTDFGGVDHLWGLAIQADGKIVAVGTGGGNTHFALARYTSDGHLDPSFDGDGMVITPFSEEGFDQAGTVVIQTNGKIVVAGSARLGPFTEFDYSFAVARYNTDGGLDPTFGAGGRVTTDFEGFRSDDAGHGVALDADGRIVVAGRRNLCNPDCRGETFALVRYLGGEAGGPGVPDLVETSLTNPPSILLLSQKFSTTDTVQNQGGGAAVGSITRYYLSLDTLKSSTDKLLSGKRSVPPLAPDATSTGLGKLTVAPSTKVGVYYLLACADVTTLVDEGNETNNCLASSTTVDVRAPDLVETSVSNPPATASPGSSFPVTDSVINQGNAAAVASTTRYYLSLDAKKSAKDPLLTGTRAVPALDTGANSTNTVTVTIAASTPSGAYYLLACADDLKRAAESIEANNCKKSTTKVTVSP